MVLLTGTALAMVMVMADHIDAFSVSPFSSTVNTRQTTVQLFETKGPEPLFFATEAENEDETEEESVEKVIPTEISKQDAVFGEAGDALRSVGWSAPLSSEEMTSEDPFVQRINAQIQKESGVQLDELLNPAKVRHKLETPYLFIM